MNRFYSRYEKALRKTATTASGGRLQGSTDVILADVANPAFTKIAKAPYELFDRAMCSGSPPVRLPGASLLRTRAMRK